MLCAIVLKSGEGLVVEAVRPLNRFGRRFLLGITATGTRSCHMELCYNKGIGMQDTNFTAILHGLMWLWSFTASAHCRCGFETACDRFLNPESELVLVIKLLAHDHYRMAEYAIHRDGYRQTPFADHLQRRMMTARMEAVCGGDGHYSPMWGHWREGV
jgi:hypothetical protein